MQANAYIVSGRRTAVIDVGMAASRLKKELEVLGLRPESAVFTHCHFDHTGAAEEFKGLYQDVSFAACGWDAAAMEDADDSRTLAGLFGEHMEGLKISRKLKDGDIIDLDGVALEVIHTPGHTPGSISLYEPQSKSLFSGDVVFADGVGRTDFPGGSTNELRQSLEKLIKLHETRGVSVLYPGHGPQGAGEDILKNYERFFR